MSGLCLNQSTRVTGLTGAHRDRRRGAGVRTSPNGSHTGKVEPGGDARWDEPPLDIQIPDDARELERDVVAYRRELRALRRRRRLRRIVPTQAGIMPLIASILAVCLVAGMMLSVFTISPVEPASRPHSTPTASTSHPATPSATATPSGARKPSATPRAHATP